MDQTIAEPFLLPHGLDMRELDPEGHWFLTDATRKSAYESFAGGPALKWWRAKHGDGKYGPSQYKPCTRVDYGHLETVMVADGALTGIVGQGDFSRKETLVWPQSITIEPEDTRAWELPESVAKASGVSILRPLPAQACHANADGDGYVIKFIDVTTEACALNQLSWPQTAIDRDCTRQCVLALQGGGLTCAHGQHPNDEAITLMPGMALYLPRTTPPDWTGGGEAYAARWDIGPMSSVRCVSIWY